MNKKTNRILEILWMVVTLLSLGATIHRIINAGLRESALFLLITFIASAMYMVRRGLRKRSQSDSTDA
jgi:hypothetical protein